jgi:hypothetical protein
MSRDLGAKILWNIASSNDEEILIRDSYDFAYDSLFCEWAYIIDLDGGFLEVYKGFNETALHNHERFYKKESERGYYGVSFLRKFSFSELNETSMNLLEED